MSSRAIGCVGVETHRGATITGSRSTRATIVSKAALPRPTIDRGPQRGHRDGPGREDGGRLHPAAQVGREVGLVLAEPAEIDDLRDARPLGLGGDVLGRSAIELGEVARAERVDEVVGDVDALERAADRAGDVGGERADPGHVRCGRPAARRR